MHRRFLFWKVWLQRSCSSHAALLVTISPSSLLLALSAAADLVLFSYAKSLVLTHLLKQRKKIGSPERSGASASQHGHFVLLLLVWCSPRDLPVEVFHLLLVFVTTFPFGCSRARNGGETVQAPFLRIYFQRHDVIPTSVERAIVWSSSSAAHESLYVDSMSWDNHVLRCRIQFTSLSM